jgi:hypothetical protein
MTDVIGVMRRMLNVPVGSDLRHSWQDFVRSRLVHANRGKIEQAARAERALRREVHDSLQKQEAAS